MTRRAPTLPLCMLSIPRQRKCVRHVFGFCCSFSKWSEETVCPKSSSRCISEVAPIQLPNYVVLLPPLLIPPSACFFIRSELPPPHSSFFILHSLFLRRTPRGQLTAGTAAVTGTVRTRRRLVGRGDTSV